MAPEFLQSTTQVPGGFPEWPDDYATSPRAAVRVADRDPEIEARRAGLEPGQELTASVSAEPVKRWEVSYFVGDEKVNLVIVDATSGEVIESWTGAAVDWPMARGNEGQFGHILNSPWVWGPLAALFLLGLWDFRRFRRWGHLDLLVLLSFGISQAFFNDARIGLSVPLAYPPLLYLLARMLWIGFRGGRGRRDGAGVGEGSAIGAGREGLRPSAPRWFLIVAIVALLILRVTANLADSGVIDVGYAGVVGADRITHGEPIYGDGAFPDDNPTGDTYGPANYFLYVPFEAALPWSGSWDELPAAHAAAIFFDLAAVVGLFVLGGALTRRRRDPAAAPPTTGPPPAPGALAASPASMPARPRDPHRLGLILAFGWVAYPYTAYTLQSNANDSLLAALLIWSLVLFARPIARGALLAIAVLTKFAPLALLPLYAAGERGLALRRGPDRTARRGLLAFGLAFLLVAALLLAHPAIDPGLAELWRRTVQSQLDRNSPFSIWGQIDLGPLHTVVKAAVVALGVLVAFRPRRRSPVQIAALSAALLIAVELTLEHWFYLYIPWFLGALLVAIAARDSNSVAPPGPVARGVQELSS